MVDGKPASSGHGLGKGYCSDLECYSCPLMQQEIAQHPPGQSNWICPACLKEVAKRSKEEGEKAFLTGHYTVGQCQYIGCTRPPRTEYDDNGELVEYPRGYSRLLQLVIGDINK